MYRFSMSTSRPTKEGELRKYKNLWSGWGKRYFKLERMYLHYFESKDAPTPVNTVTRGDIDTVKLSTSFPGQQNVFEVHTKSGLVWYLQTSSHEELVSWMKALMPSYVDSALDEGRYQAHPLEPTAPPLEVGLNQGPYNGPQPHIYPNLYSPGAPLYDPRVHGHTEHSPPPPYEEK